MKNIEATDAFSAWLDKMLSSRIRRWAVAIFAILLYINTTGNKYALDDIPIVRDNRYVQQGFGGISDILSSDMFASMFEDYNVEQQLSGGRYRPLSMISFAAEYQFFGSAPSVSHFINTLIYGIIILLIFRFLEQYLRLSPTVVFISTLLFAIHPIHTEVVANIKSRDELFSMLFILLTFMYGFRYMQKPQPVTLSITGVSLFLAYLSKEYAFVLLGLLPVSIYIFSDAVDKKKLITLTATLVAVTALYAFIRISAVGMNVVKQNDILNNPYLLATPAQVIATKLFVLLKYVLLLLWPHPLSSDYSFNTIPYLSFGSPLVWISILCYVAMVVLMIRGIMKKQVWGFALAWYLAFLFPVSNLLLDIGATMGERLIFHASLGFCLLLGIGASKLVQRIPAQPIAGALVLIVLLCSFKTICRNKDWKDDDTLFTKDIYTVPNSILVNNNAADALIRKGDHAKDTQEKAALLKQAKAYTTKAIGYYPGFTNGLINHGLIFHIEGNDDSAMAYWMKAKSTLPNDPHFPRLSDYFYNMGVNTGRSNVPKAISEFTKAVQLFEVNAKAWSDLGGAYYTLGKYDSARYCWEKTLALDPNNTNARNGYNAVIHNNLHEAK